MRNLFSKLMTASVVAGALLVSACGGESATTDNTATTDLNAMEPLDGTMNDVTAVDAMNGVDANMMDMNATDMNSMDMNASADMNSTDMNATTNAM